MLDVRRWYLIVAPRPMPTAPLVVCCRYLAVVLRPLPAASFVLRRKYLIVVPRSLPRRHGAAAAREYQLRRFTAERSKNYQLYLYSDKVALAAMYLR